MNKLLTKRLAVTSTCGNSGRKVPSVQSLSRLGLQAQSVCDSRSVEMYMDDPRLDELQIVEVISAQANEHGVWAKMVVRSAKQIVETDEPEPLKRESMGAGKSRYDSRTPNLGCGPLRAFLCARLGQPVEQVKDELYKRAGKKYFYRDALLHVFDWLVKKNVAFGADGVIYDLDRSDGFNALTKNFYVHPENGTLEKVPSPVKPDCKLRYEQVDVDETHKLVKLDGLWFMVCFAPVLPASDRPVYGCGVVDFITKQPAYCEAMTSYARRDYKQQCELDWGSKVYALSKRAAGKSELRKHGIRR